MESDLSLINKIKETRDSGCLTELISRHSGIYVYIVDQYTKNKSASYGRETIMEDKDFMIYQTALSYNPDKNSKFSTFLANQTKWKCLNFLNNSKLKREVSMETVYNEQYSPEDSYSTISKLEAFDIFNSMLEEESDKRVKKIIDIRYNTTNNKLIPWRRVAKDLNMSIQGCINIHNKFLEKVKTKFDKDYV